MNSSRADRLFQDYSVEEVPPDKTRTWLSMGLVWSGVGISLGLLLTGGTVAQGLTITQAVVAAVLGGVILAVISTLTGIVGARAHLSTAMVSRFAFGNRAVLLIAMLQALGAYGWFAVQLGLFARAASTAWESTTGLGWSDGPFIVIGGLLMIATSIIGYRALDALSKVAVPLMVLLMAASVWRILQDSTTADIVALRGTGPALTLGTGISLVVSSFVVGAVIAPDVSRYAKSPRHVVGGAVLAFAVVTPAVLAVGSMMALETGTSDIVTVLLRLGWGSLALLLLMLAQWTSNDNNLYSAALGFVVVLRNWKKWQLTGIAGVIGIVLALAGIYDSFTTFLTVLGIFVPPMAGVIVIDYYLTRKTVYRGGFETTVVPVRVLPLIAWAVGSGASAVTSYTDMTLTSISAVDGLLVAAILQMIFGRFLDKRSPASPERPAKGYEYAG